MRLMNGVLLKLSAISTNMPISYVYEQSSQIIQEFNSTECASPADAG
jgi:hypothetical protein